VCLEGLDLVEVGSLALREAVLTIKLKLGDHDGVKTPAMHVEGGLGEDERSGVGDFGGGAGRSISHHTIGEKTRGVDDITGTGIGGEGADGVRESINGIGVIEGLGSHGPVEGVATLERRAVINVGIGLDNPDKLLTGVVEVELDLVGRRTDGLVTGELELLNQVLVGVLGHSAALIGVEEHVIDVKRCGDKRLAVGTDSLDTGGGGGGKLFDGPQALIDGAKIKVDLDLVVLKSNQGKGKTGAAAKPELKRYVKSGLRKGVAGSTHLGGCVGITTGSVDGGELGVGGIDKLGGVTNHLVVSTGLLGAQGKLSPDVHPVAILAVDALTTNLELHLGDKLVTGEIKPTGIFGAVGVNFRKSDLKVCAVGKIAVAADSASHAATEVGLTVECLLDGLHREVGVSAISNLPESNLRVTSKVNVLCAIGNELH
jgi:hypothetical protein